MSGDEELMEVTFEKISRGDVRALRVSAEHYGWLVNTIIAERAAMTAVVQTAGGLVEGLPTGSHNILQRIRELRKLEL